MGTQASSVSLKVDRSFAILTLAEGDSSEDAAARHPLLTSRRDKSLERLIASQPFALEFGDEGWHLVSKICFPWTAIVGLYLISLPLTFVEAVVLGGREGLCKRSGEAAQYKRSSEAAPNKRSPERQSTTTTPLYIPIEALPPPPLNISLKSLQTGIMAGLNAPEVDWKTRFDALSCLQSAAVHIPAVVLDLLLESAMPVVLELCGSLRSGLAKNACLTLSIIGKALGGHIPPEYYFQVIPVLGLKVSITPKFVAEVALTALHNWTINNNNCTKAAIDALMLPPLRQSKASDIQLKRSLLLAELIQKLLEAPNKAITPPPRQKVDIDRIENLNHFQLNTNSQYYFEPLKFEHTDTMSTLLSDLSQLLLERNARTKKAARDILQFLKSKKEEPFLDWIDSITEEGERLKCEVRRLCR